MRGRDERFVRKGNRRLRRLLTALLCVVLCAADVIPTGMTAYATLGEQDTEPRAALAASELAGGTFDNITWKIDGSGKLTVTGQGNFKDGEGLSQPWGSYRSSITSAEVSVTGMRDASWMFYGCSKLKSVNLSGLDTSKVTDMSSMFSGCTQLARVDLSHFKTGEVEQLALNGMFQNCSSLTELDLSSFDTSNVTNMAYMFDGCSKLADVDLSSFNTQNTTSMAGMFRSCSALESLDLSHFNTANVVDMNSMFYGCKNLTSLNVKSFNTANVVNMNSMFRGLDKLRELNLRRFNTANVTDMSYMFGRNSGNISSGRGLEKLNVSNFDTSSVTKMRGMFESNDVLKELDMGSFYMGSVTDVTDMFYGCKALARIRTPRGLVQTISLPTASSGDKWYQPDGSTLTEFPRGSETGVVVQRNQVPDPSEPFDPIDPIEPDEPSDPDGPVEFPVETEVEDDPNAVQIRLVDTAGKPIAGATVTYNNKSSVTNEKGIAKLEDYAPRKSGITITKEGYYTILELSFVKSETGRTTFVMSPKPEDEWEAEDFRNAGDIVDSAILEVGGQKTDLVKQWASINKAYGNMEFSIRCKTKTEATYDNYALKSDGRTIAESASATFEKLQLKDFKKKTDVFLVAFSGGEKKISKRLNLEVVEESLPIEKIDIADDWEMSIPEDTPLVGGNKISLAAKILPLEYKMESDGTIEVGINFVSLAMDGEDFDDLWSKVKPLNAGTASKFFGKRKYSVVRTNSIKPDFKIVGYLEGNVRNKDYLQGKLFVEASLAFDTENQIQLGPVPAVVELTIEGKINADGTVKWSAKEGVEGSVGVGGGVGLELYGGVGFAHLISGGIYGKAEANLHIVLLPEDKRGVDEASVGGALGVKGKMLEGEVELALLQGTFNIIGGGKSRAASGEAGWERLKLDDYGAYTPLARDYLTADGDMPEWLAETSTSADGAVEETVLLASACMDMVPRVVRAGDTVMLFYLSDAGAERNAVNRSLLVYSLWDKTAEKWGEPKAVLDDGTADFSPDLYSDGETIYAVWQNAEESLAEGLALSETAERLTLHAAVYDGVQGQFVSLGDIRSESGLLQKKPQIVADDGEVTVYWHENAEDNILGLKGTNRIYQAVLRDGGTESGAAQTLGDETESGTEDTETEDTETEDTETEDTETEDTETEDSQAEDTDTENADAEENTADNTESDIPAAGGDAAATDSTFRQYVALEEETEETKTEGTRSGEEGEELKPEKPEEEGEEPKPEKPEEGGEEPKPEEPGEGGEELNPEEPGEEEESVSENTLPEETVSENTISENTIPAMLYGAEERAEQPWEITLLKEETDCIISEDAGKAKGKIGYAYTAGKLEADYDLSSGRTVFLAQGEEEKTVGTGALGAVKFTQVYASETLTWYLDGDIRYLDESGSAASLFGERRLPSSTYTLLSDGAGNLEVVFPVNSGGRSNLYRIGREGGKFLAALPITDQEDYIQYVDGFVDGGRTVLAYNRMEVNDQLEEVNNRLCMGTLAHSYSDVVMQSAGNMILRDEKTGKDTLEISASLYNNGTAGVQELSLTLAAPDGTVLETIPIDTVLEPGEADYGTAVFSLEKITEAADYTLTVSGVSGEVNEGNNSCKIALGGASLRVNAELIAVEDTRTIQAGIENTGVAPCGGTISVRDVETGVEYCSAEFEPVMAGATVIVEAVIDKEVFVQKEAIGLEVIVTPDTEGVEAVRDFLTAYVPVYEVRFVTDDGEDTVCVSYGEGAEFPENPVREGAYFAGWYDSQDQAAGTIYTEETKVTADVALYARFVEEKSEIPMTNCSVLAIPIQLYTGKALKPKITVKWGSEVLDAKKDYSVSYQNNKDQGRASVTVTGKGRYKGSITRTFQILYPISKASVSALPAVDFSGENYTPSVTVTFNKKKLKKNTDYTVAYSNNRNAGTAGVTITGKGSYTGTKTVTFQINGINIAKMQFDAIPNATYSRNASRPVVTVKTKDGVQLQAGSDYRVVTENTANKGTATVTVVGNGNYTGSKKLTYKVLAKPLTSEMISEIEEAVYTGSAIKPELVVTDEGEKLEPGKDYTVSYSKNKAAGTAVVKVKGKGNYSGTVQVSFTIQKCSLEGNAQIEVRASDVAYTGKAVKPKVQVYADGKKLSGSAYTLSYANNTEKGTGTVTVTGKGNYSGAVTAQFRIVDKAKLITSLKIDKIADSLYTGEAIEPDVKIMDGDYQLKKGTDYKTAYRSQYHAGKAVVTVTGIGSYAGSKDVTYKINKRPIASKNILETGFTVEKAPDEKYTGYALKPDMAVSDRGRRLELGKDYKLSYKKNTKIGTAQVTVKGIGDYSGSINTLTFNIVGWDYSDLRAEVEDQVYTGKALKPKVTFYHAGEPIELKSGTAVKIAYQDNKNAGTAIVTVTGKGELAGITPFTAKFTVEQADMADAVVKRIADQNLKGVAPTPVPSVKVGKNTLKAGRDFTVSYVRNGVKGEATAILTGTGNYTGECRKTFIVK